MTNIEVTIFKQYKELISNFPNFIYFEIKIKFQFFSEFAEKIKYTVDCIVHVTDNFRSIILTRPWALNMKVTGKGLCWTKKNLFSEQTAVKNFH